MENLIKSGFKGNELDELNKCQIYLKVTCLSDVSTGDGLSIPPHHERSPKLSKNNNTYGHSKNKKNQPSIGNVAILPRADLQTHPNTGSTTSQNNGELALRIGYHRLDILPLPIKNLPSLLCQMASIPPTPKQERTGQSYMIHPWQRTPSAIPPWQHNTNQIRWYLRTVTQNHWNFTHDQHTKSRHHDTPLDPANKPKWKHSAKHSTGDQE